MSFDRLHKWVAYAIAGLGLLALGLGAELSPTAQVLFGAGFVISMFVEGAFVHGAGYALAWNLAVVAALMLQVLRGLAFGPTLALAIEFAAFLQVSRLFNRRSAADYQQIAVLAMLHLIAGTVLSTDLTYAAIFFGFLIVTPWMLALSHLRKEIEGHYPSQQDPDPQTLAAIRRVLASRRVVGPGFLVGTAALSVPLFFLTLVIFVAVPRVGKGFLALEQGRAQPVAGFGDEVELGGFGTIRDDPTVVLRVTPMPKVDEKAQRLVLRMRGTSFDHYDGRRWTRTRGERTPLERTADYYKLLRWPDARADERMRIVLDRLQEPVVFLPEGTVGISVPPRIVDGREVTRRIVQAPGLDVRYRDADEAGLTYVAHVGDATAGVREALAPGWRARYLQLPADHRRIAAEARRLTFGIAGDADKAEAIERHLSRSGQLRYSLEQPEVGERSPLEVFLFDAKRGHCEYFSTAMAVMLRTLGIPARNVTGFVGGRYNRYGGYYALRQGDAHSWVEAYLDGRGWVTFDPTPATRAMVGPGEGPMADLQAMIDALRTRWSTTVVGYDLRTQFGMLRDVMRWLKRARQDRTEPEAPGTGAEPSRPWRTTLGVALAVALSGLLWWWRRRQRGRRAGARDRGDAAREARAIYAALERALARQGRARGTSVTPTEHAQRLSRDGYRASDAVREVTQRYMAVRYGGEPLDPEEARRLRSLVRQVRSVENRPTPRSAR